LNRHCERSEAIHRAAWTEWIASSLSLLAMTENSGFEPKIIPPSCGEGWRAQQARWTQSGSPKHSHALFKGRLDFSTIGEANLNM